MRMDAESIEILSKENHRVKLNAMTNVEQESTHYPKFRDQQEKHRVFHTITAIEKVLLVIGNDDAIDDISILKELVRKIEVEE